jgi:hypothetical protein
MVLTKPR